MNNPESEIKASAKPLEPPQGSKQSDRTESFDFAKAESFDLERIWHEKGKDYEAPYSEVLGILSDWLIEELRPGWDRDTPIKEAWWLQRDKGMKAWAKYRATMQLTQLKRKSYTLLDFRELRFIDAMRAGNDSVKDDEDIADFVAYKTQSDGKDFLLSLGKLERRLPIELNRAHCLWCFLYDRGQIPFEFWTYSAASKYLSENGKRLRLPVHGLTPEALRLLACRFGLKVSKPSIVTEYPAQGEEFKFNRKATEKHGMPHLLQIL